MPCVVIPAFSDLPVRSQCPERDGRARGLAQQVTTTASAEPARLGIPTTGMRGRRPQTRVPRMRANFADSRQILPGVWLTAG
jgi:hypothetical protein